MLDKVDLSGRAFKDAFPPAKIGFSNRCLITAGGFQPDWAVQHGKPNEIWNIKLVGAASFVCFMFWTASITTGLHVILDFDRSFDFGLILIALLIASAQALTDHITLVKSAIFAKGEALLKTAAFKLPSARAGSKTYRLVNTARPVQGFAFAAISVTFILLAAQSPGIHAILWSYFQKDNSTAFAQAARIVDDQKARDLAALATKTGEVNSLTRSASSRPDVVRQATRKSGSASAGSDAASERLQKQLAEAENKRDSLRSAVERDDAERNSNIEKMVTSSPQAVPRRTDLAAQLGALWQLIAESPLMWVVAALLVVVGCSLELGFMWVAAGYPSAPLCARLVLEDYDQLTQLAKDGRGRLDIRPDEHTSDPPDDRPPTGGASAAAIPPEPPFDEPASPMAPSISPSNSPEQRPIHSPATTMNGGTAIKRGPGRPRKAASTLNLTERPNG